MYVCVSMHASVYAYVYVHIYVCIFVCSMCVRVSLYEKTLNF